MSSVNKVILIGHLGRDSELKYTQGGQAVANFSLATTKKWTKDNQPQEKTEWHNVIIFGKIAESLSPHLKKGNQCYVEGELQTRSWDDKDGKKCYKTEINAHIIQLLGSKQKNTDNNQPITDDLPF